MSTNYTESLISGDGFQKSTYSMNNQNCAEMRQSSHGVDIRDTQNRDAGHLAFPGPEWSALVGALHPR